MKFVREHSAEGEKEYIMQTHFRSFTGDAMRTFGQNLAAEIQQRRDLFASRRQNVQAMLANFREERDQDALREADARRLFVSELRSEVNALRKRFELTRRETAAVLQQMVDELGEASSAFRDRFGPKKQGRKTRS